MHLVEGRASSPRTHSLRNLGSIRCGACGVRRVVSKAPAEQEEERQSTGEVSIPGLEHCPSACALMAPPRRRGLDLISPMGLGENWDGLGNIEHCLSHRGRAGLWDTQILGSVARFPV